MKDVEMKMKLLTKEAMGDVGVAINKAIQSASSDIRSAIETAYYEGYNDGKREATKKAPCPHRVTFEEIHEVLVRT